MRGEAHGVVRECSRLAPLGTGGGSAGWGLHRMSEFTKVLRLSFALTAALALSLAPGVGTDHAFGRSVLYYVGWVDSLVSVRSAITVEASVPARPTAEQRFRNGHGFALRPIAATAHETPGAMTMAGRLDPSSSRAEWPES